MNDNYEATYWNRKGRYQELFNRLYAMLVPPEGRAATEEGEVLRIAVNVYYDRHNNGCVNYPQMFGDMGTLRFNVRSWANTDAGWCLTWEHADDRVIDEAMDEIIELVARRAAEHGWLRPWTEAELRTYSGHSNQDDRIALVGEIVRLRAALRHIGDGNPPPRGKRYLTDIEMAQMARDALAARDAASIVPEAVGG